jgi:heme oxygenase
MSNQETVSLTARILQATRTGHDKTDRLAQLRAVTALRDARLYRQLLRDFWAVYQSFEEAWLKILQVRGTDDKEHLDHTQEILANVWMPELARTAAFEVDLEFYYKDDARMLLESNAATTSDSSSSFDDIAVAKQALKLADESMSLAAKAYKVCSIDCTYLTILIHV